MSERTVIHEDEHSITYRETYQTHWNPDRIGGALVYMNKEFIRQKNKEIANRFASRSVFARLIA